MFCDVKFFFPFMLYIIFANGENIRTRFDPIFPSRQPYQNYTIRHLNDKESVVYEQNLRTRFAPNVPPEKHEPIDKHIFANSEANARILDQNYILFDDLSYKANVETSNQISIESEGKVIPSKNSDQNTIEVKGRYSYVMPDGEQFWIRYRADEDGLKVSGNQIPTTPEPPIFVKSLLAYMKSKNIINNNLDDDTYNFENDRRRRRIKEKS